MSKKLEKANAIIDYLLEEQYVKLNVPTLRKLMEIDPNFDFNKFKITRMPMTIMYSKSQIFNWTTRKNELVGDLDFKKMNTNNCHNESIYDMLGFKLKTSDKVETDLNLFVREIDDVSSIIQKKCTNWKTGIYEKVEYQVRYLPSKKNIKTFRFVLHSHTKRSHTIKIDPSANWSELEEYYINGNSMKKEDWIKYSREYKLSRIVK